MKLKAEPPVRNYWDMAITTLALAGWMAVGFLVVSAALVLLGWLVETVNLLLS